MNKSVIFVILILIVVAGLLGYNYFVQPFANLYPAPSPQADSVPIEPQLSVEEQLFAVMSSEQKVAQLLAVSVVISPDSSPSAASVWIKERQPGTVNLFGTQVDVASVQSELSQLDGSEWPVPPLIAVDHEGGQVQRLNGQGFTKLASWRELCASQEFDTQLLSSSAAELRDAGVNVIYGPVVDVGTSAVLGSRICSSHQDLVIERAGQLIKIYQEHQLLPVIKHFPGIGMIKQDLHTSFANVSVRPEDAVVYLELLKQYPLIGVMVSHAGVENQYAQAPCSLSKTCVDELVGLYPQALVMTDDLNMESVRYNFRQPDQPKDIVSLTTEALYAGNDILVFGRSTAVADLDLVLTELSIKYESDVTFQKRVDQALLKVIRYKLQLGVLGDSQQ